jgi:hypothetical protein
MRRTPALTATLMASIWACDPQADSKYLGEPLVTLRGQVTSSTPLPPLEAAMLWQRGAPPSTNDQELATRAPVQTGFPASFTVHLYQPPPARARRTLAPGEVTFARANAGAVPPGMAEEAAVGPPAAGPMGTGGAAGGAVGYGIDAMHWVVYLESDVPPQSLTAWWLGTPLKAGFHFLRATPFNPQCFKPGELDACAADLVSRGVPDDGTNAAGTARSYCLAPYRLSIAAPGEQIVLELGTAGLPAAGGTCP